MGKTINLDLTLTSYKNINSKWSMYFIVKYKTIKLLDKKNTKENLRDLG